MVQAIALEGKRTSVNPDCCSYYAIALEGKQVPVKPDYARETLICLQKASRDSTL